MTYKYYEAVKFYLREIFVSKSTSGLQSFKFPTIGKTCNSRLCQEVRQDAGCEGMFWRFCPSP